MNEYLQTQITLLGKLRVTLRVVGIVLGVAAAAGPILIFAVGFSGAFSNNTVSAFTVAVLFIIGVPIGINFMCLAIALRGRMANLKAMDAATNNPGEFRQLLSTYLSKIKTHRIVLWVLGGLIALQSFSSLASIAGGLGLGSPLETSYAEIISSLVVLMVAAAHGYLGLVLSRQIKDLTPSLTATN